MSETYPCAACCAETENEPQAICDACDQADREATAARLNQYRAALERLYNATVSVRIFVNSRERIEQTTGKQWFEDELAAAFKVLNP